MLKEIDKALELGAEIFLMDAGWFGSKDKWWYQVRGDYYENELLENSMSQIFDIARSKGLKIGLWVEIEGITFESELYKKHPDWVIKAYNKEIPTLNLLLPEVRDYLYNELNRIIEKYNIDVFRIDGGLKEPSEMICNNEIIETSWEYYEHLFNIFEKVREKHSNVYFENCSGGAGRSDLAIMKRFDWMSLTDLFEVVSSLRVAYGLSLAFLPEQMHTSTTLTNISKGNELFATRIAMFGHFTIHGVIDRMNEYSMEAMANIRREIELYKNEIRPIFSKSNLYHHTKFVPYLEKPEWIVWELSSINKDKSIIQFYKLNNANNNTYTIKPRGILSSKKYDVYLDNTQEHYTINGHKLINDGLSVTLYGNLESEIVILTNIE